MVFLIFLILILMWRVSKGDVEKRGAGMVRGFTYKPWWQKH